MQNQDNRGARLVRTVVEQAGWPVAGDVVKGEGMPPRVSVALGHDQTLWVNDPAYLRALATAALAGAHALEAEQPADAGVREDQESQETPPTTEAPPVLAAPVLEGFRPPPAGVAAQDPPVPCPNGCGQLVYPGPNGLMHRVQGGTAAACPPEDDQETSVFPRIQPERVG